MRKIRKILIVDDDREFLGIVSQYLNAYDFETLLAENVLEAVQLLEVSHIDALLSDFQMPGGSGLDLLAHVSALYPQLPFIMMTGCQSASLKHEVIRMGGIGCMEKPFSLRDLVTVLGDLPETKGEECGQEAEHPAPCSSWWNGTLN